LIVARRRFGAAAFCAAQSARRTSACGRSGKRISVTTDGSGKRRGPSKSRIDETPPKRTAVALHYQPVNADSAPKVVASGRGWVAEKILEVAFANGVKVREDADLAEILAAVDLDEEIPVEAFIAVAEILRYVYAANGTQPPEV
jgi:flagellar biosynthesis protein